MRRAIQKAVLLLLLGLLSSCDPIEALMFPSVNVPTTSNAPGDSLKQLSLRQQFSEAGIGLYLEGLSVKLDCLNCDYQAEKRFSGGADLRFADLPVGAVLAIAVTPPGTQSTTTSYFQIEDRLGDLTLYISAEGLRFDNQLLPQQPPENIRPLPAAQPVPTASSSPGMASPQPDPSAEVQQGFAGAWALQGSTPDNFQYLNLSGSESELDGQLETRSQTSEQVDAFQGRLENIRIQGNQLRARVTGRIEQRQMLPGDSNVPSGEPVYIYGVIFDLLLNKTENGQILQGTLTMIQMHHQDLPARIPVNIRYQRR